MIAGWVVNLDEATTVKHIYERYLELGSVRLLKNDLVRHEVVSKVRVSKNGVRSGGQQFLARGSVPDAVEPDLPGGEIRHKKERHPGQHPPIVSRELWEKVQQRLCDQAAKHRERPTRTPPSPLAGKLLTKPRAAICARSGKGMRHYRYYVSRGLVRGAMQDDQRGWR